MMNNQEIAKFFEAIGGQGGQGATMRASSMASQQSSDSNNNTNKALNYASVVSNGQRGEMGETASTNGQEQSDLPPGYVEEKVKVDRKRFESMVEGEDPELGTADNFFGKIMEETGTDISWPRGLRQNAKTKKDPHVRIVGEPEAVNAAKDRVLEAMDARRNRVTIKMDIAFTDHSHIIGKQGRSIQSVMDATGTHIHFPDSNRTCQEKSNQVSIAGTAQGAETARCKVRNLLPFTAIFEVPLNGFKQVDIDPTSSTLSSIASTYGVTIHTKLAAKNQNTFLAAPGTVTVTVRGTRSQMLGMRQAIMIMIEYFTGSQHAAQTIGFTTTLEIAAQHHSFVQGRGSCNIRTISQSTGCAITFPEVVFNQMGAGATFGAASGTGTGPLSVTINGIQVRKSTVIIQGKDFDSVFMAWSQLLDFLPLVLIFDLKENATLDAAMITQLMEQLKVSILIKPKHKQNVKSIVVRGCEKDSRLLFQVRKEILGLDDSEIPICCDNHGLSIFKKIVQSFPVAAIHQPAAAAINKPDDSVMQALNQLAAMNPQAAQCLAAAIFAGKNDHGGQQVNPVMLSSLKQNPSILNQPTLPSFPSGSSSFGRYNPLTPSSTPLSPSSPDSRYSEQGSPKSITKSFFAGQLKTLNSNNNLADKDGICNQWNKEKMEAWKYMRQEPAPDKTRYPTDKYCHSHLSQTHPINYSLPPKDGLEWLKPLDKIPEFVPQNQMFKPKPSEQSGQYNPPKSFASTWGPEPGSSRSIESVLSTLFGREEWNLEAVLVASDLEKFLPIFNQHDIDLSTFLTLNMADLQSIGIPYVQRQKMMSIINELNRLLASQEQQQQQEPTSPLPEFPTTSRSSIPPPPGMSLPDIIQSQMTNFNPAPGAGRQSNQK